MTYHIFNEVIARGSTGFKDGLSAYARISCPEGLRPEQAALDAVIPGYGRVAATLMSYHDGSSAGPAEYDDFGASILVEVCVHHGSNRDSRIGIENYVNLLERWLRVMPNDYDGMRAIQDARHAWSHSLLCTLG